MWRYGATDPFALVSIYVHPDRLAEARRLLDEASAESYEFEDVSGPPDLVEMPDPFIRNRPLRWWLAAFVAAGLILALVRSSLTDLLF